MISYRSFEHSSALQRAKRGTVNLRQPSTKGCISQSIFCFFKFRTQVAAFFCLFVGQLCLSTVLRLKVERGQSRRLLSRSDTSLIEELCTLFFFFFNFLLNFHI